MGRRCHEARVHRTAKPARRADPRFVAHKRALNRRFDTEERALRLLDRYLVEHGVADLAGVTPAVLDAFLTSRPRQRPRSYNHLLGVLRRLFDWMVDQEILGLTAAATAAARDGATPSIPFRPAACLPAHRGRGRAAGQQQGAPARPDLRDDLRAPLRARTACWRGRRLTRADVDLGRRLLVIRETKFAKSRFVPFGPRMAARLAAYLDLRERPLGLLAPEAPVFSFTQGRAIHPGTISQTFHALVPRLGLALPAGIGSPRVHDLRHSFAVGTLLRWYREGADPAARLLHLSTFLGHVNPASTAVYLTITADLCRPPASALSASPRRCRREVRHDHPWPIVYAFFERHLKAEKGLSPASVRSYRDALRLFLAFLAADAIGQSPGSISDLTAERVRQFLGHLETDRGNHIRTRNQRLAGLHTFFSYLAGQVPEVLAEAERVAAVPRKRVPHAGHAVP